MNVSALEKIELETPGLVQRVLVVDDDDDTRTTLKNLLQHSLNLIVDVAADGLQALEMLHATGYSLMITDLRMPKLTGMKLIEQIQKLKLPVTTIVTTGHGNIPDAVDAMRLGAYDFLTKPAAPQQLCLLVKRALEERALRDEIQTLRDKLQGKHSSGNMISKSPRMQEIFNLVEHLAETSTTVLIRGETGTGKEQLARAIHQASSYQRQGDFIAINCAAIPETLLESELFGHEKGSFTGAISQRKGRFELAHGGTLFLDEVGDIPAVIQIKLLRVLQERKFDRIGGNETIQSDFRLITATNQSLQKLVNSGKFREDLLYRLNVVEIELPPLRERPEDIPLLAATFIQHFSPSDQQTIKITPDAMEKLLAYDWPGNIRQLENAMERACLTARDSIIDVGNLHLDGLRSISKQTLPVDLSRTLTDQLTELTESFEKRYLRRALKRTRGHVGKCAKITGLSRRSITDKLAQHGINKCEFKID